MPEDTNRLATPADMPLEFGAVATPLVEEALRLMAPHVRAPDDPLEKLDLHRLLSAHWLAIHGHGEGSSVLPAYSSTVGRVSDVAPFASGYMQPMTLSYSSYGVEYRARSRRVGVMVG